ncbi:hypothetical protein PMAYCL1PPCAC_32568, partial [Pristionchus mayeri]
SVCRERMRTPLVLAALTTTLALADLSIVEKRDTAAEVFQLRSKRCSHFDCEDTADDMSNALRHVFLFAHNDMRESIVRGTEVGKAGLLPQSANMYKLNWNCELEMLARDWTSKCLNEAVEPAAGRGQNFIVLDDIEGDLAHTVAKTIGDWRRQVLQADLASDIKYNAALKIQQWANMANSETTEIGCSVNRCGATGTGLALTCFYNKAGDVPDHVIYVGGAPCKFDYDCAGQENSYCVPLTGLCHRHEKGATPGTSHICPLNTKMTDFARHTVLDWHNSLRSNLAFGKEEDGEGSFAPMAKGMLKMHYDCTLEKSAQEAAERCRFSPYKNGKSGENIFLSEQKDWRRNQISLLQQATKQWWNEMKQGGVAYNNTFTRKDYMENSHFTQMAWSITYRVGCATNVCGDKNFAVCHYSPSGNKFGHKVYTYGSPCKAATDCDKGQTCAAEEGLCVVSLE